MQTHTSRIRSTVAVLVSAIFGTVVATGALVISFVLLAAARGYSPLGFYARTFPAYRGPGVSGIPALAYAIFFLYVLVAAEIAIASRRRM
ncbi:MAG TPA: hypothetical protein VGD79_07970 [Thermoanaerobaculia bacterium]